MTQTKTEIRALLAAAGVQPLKRFGQHFLIDGNLMDKLVAAAGVRGDDVVLEVGPGTGALTEKLLAAAGHVVAVEIDRTLHAICQDRLAGAHGLGGGGRLTLIHADVLERKSVIAGEVLRALAKQKAVLGGRIMLVANLPYQVATPLLINLLLGELRVSPMCFTVQAEVAERILAAPGNKTYGPISVFVQALATVERVARVPPGAFWPVPKVDSTMLRIDAREDQRPAPAVVRKLTEVVHGCFNHRRKTMKSNLQALLDGPTLERVQAAGKWDLSDRPERFTVTQWVELAAFLSHV